MATTATMTEHKAKISQMEESDSTTMADILTEEEMALEKKLRKKIDVLIMPLIVIIYIINYIDRNNYAAARLQGLETDLNLTPTQYQVGLSIFFVGYVLAQLPANMILNHFGRPSLHMAFFTVAWGLVTLSTAWVKGYGGIVACRIILGIVEAPLFPGILFFLSKWYTKSELAFRMSIFFSGSFIGGAFGNLIAAGILNGLAGLHGLKAWQWLYIIEGIITIVIGVVTIFILPDFPQTWKMLSPEMKAVATKRIALEASAEDTDESGKMSQIKGLRLAALDLNVWILALMYFCITGAAGFQNFLPSLTATLGYSRIVSLLLVAPPYIFTTIYSYGHSLASDRKAEGQNARFWFYMYPIPISIVGFVVFTATPVFGAKYFSIFLMMFCLAINGTFYGWIAAVVSRPPAKRAVTYAIVNSIGNSTSIWTPFTYRSTSGGQFRLAMFICVGLQCVAAVLGVILRMRVAKKERRDVRDA